MECVEGDRDGDNTDWEKRLDRADKYVDRLFARPTYDMRNRSVVMLVIKDAADASG